MVCPTSTFWFNNPIGEESRDTTTEASKILEQDKYVDDLIHSCSSTQNAYLRIVELEKILNASGFKIKEWQVKVTPHDGRSFYKIAHRALNSYAFPIKFGMHNNKSSLNLTM